MLLSFAVVLLLAKPATTTTTTSAPKAPQTVVEGNQHQQPAGTASQAPNSTTINNVITEDAKRDSDHEKERPYKWTISDAIQLAMVIVAALYLGATMRLVKYTGDANTAASKRDEAASKRDAASLKQTRTSNALTQRALMFNRDSFKLTHKASLGIHKVISGDTPIDIVVVIRNVGATTAHYIIPYGGFARQANHGKPDIRSVKDPLLLLGFLSPGGGVSLGPGCDIAIKRSPHTDGLRDVDESCDDLYYSASILYRDEWETWHRYRFIATYEPNLKDHWTAHSDQHKSGIEFQNFAKAFIDKLTQPD